MELRGLPEIYRGPLRSVVQVVPGVLIKYCDDFAEEVRTTLYARKHFSFPVPRVLHHPPLYRGSTHSRSSSGAPTGVWYICVEQCPGVSLEKVIGSMSSSELIIIAEQLRAILSEMSIVHPKTLGSVTKGPYRNGFFPRHILPLHAFSTYTEFIDFYRYILLHFCTESFADALLSKLPRHVPLRFAHGDLHPGNIIVEGTTITGIIDWAEAGFWPGFWEYCRMHQRCRSSPAWDQVLGVLFHGEKRQAEIDAVDKLITIVGEFFYAL